MTIRQYKGRPSKYKPAYCKKLVDYFNVDPFETIKDQEGRDTGVYSHNFPSFQRFANMLGVSVDTLKYWAKKNADFLVAIKKAKELQESFLTESALYGLINSTFAIFTAKNVCGWSDAGRLGDLFCPIHRCKTPAAKIKRIQQAVNEGTATLGQAKMLADQVLAEVAVKDATEYEKEIKDLRGLIDSILNERNRQHVISAARNAND